MYGISTSWNFHTHSDARSIVDEIRRLGIDHVELNFQLSKRIVSEFEGLVNQNYVKVLSVHNFCPVPDGIEIERASPDYYSLASIDEAERKKAVEYTKQTIDTTCRLSAPAVVIHAGRVNIKDRTRELAKIIENRIDATSFINDMYRERDEELKMGYVDRLLKSLGEISEYARKCNIRIGLENRFYFRELPSIEEFEIIFKYFGKDSNIHYWHDTGHAQVFENLGFSSHRDYLDKFGQRLVGVHLHDVKHIIDDHNAPLTGNFDFTLLKPYVNSQTLKVLEPHAPATFEEITKGLEYLRKLYGD